MTAALTWRTSSYSDGDGGNCVEVAETHGAVLVRDTKHRNDGHLTFPTHEWNAFLKEIETRTR